MELKLKIQINRSTEDLSKYLVDFKSTVLDILALKRPLTVDKLVSYILLWYESKSLIKLKRSDIPIMTETLFKKTLMVIKVCKLVSKNFNDVFAIRIQQRIRKTIMLVNQTCNMAKKQAPVIEWNITKKIAKSLWEDISVSRGSNITSIRNRKAAATALLLAHTSGGRWIDIHRMKWEDLKFKKTIDTMYVQAPLRFSKNNLTNNVPQALQWASSVSTDKSDCPWTIFRRWWIWCGRPTKGFVFANGAGKMLSGNSTIYHVQAHARKLNLPDHQIPRKHSGRVTMVLTLDKLNMSKRSIIRGLNWRTDTMVNYYMNTRSMCAKNAPSHRLSKLKAGQLSQLQKDLD